MSQALAPQFPSDAAVGDKRRERQRWRRAWYPYAKSLEALVERMKAAEQAKQHPDVAIVGALATIVRSIGDDINATMANEPELRIGDNWFEREFGTPLPIPNVAETLAGHSPRTTPSYLKYSQAVLGTKQVELETLLGSGEQKQWPGYDDVFGQAYLKDQFREILHYRPQGRKPEGWAGRFNNKAFWIFSISAIYFAITVLYALYTTFRWANGEPIFDDFWRGVCSLILWGFHVPSSLWQTVSSMFADTHCSATAGSASATNTFAALPPIFTGQGPHEFKVHGVMKLAMIGR